MSSRCPHCLYEGGVERSRALRWRCRACGGPVVPAEGLPTRSNGELASLVTAQRTWAIATACNAAAWMFGVAAALGAGVVVLLRQSTVMAVAVVAFVVTVLVGLSALSARQGMRHAAEARASLDCAWERVAAEIATAREKGQAPGG